MPSLEWNKQVWGTDWAWERAGDEWSGMAEHCGQPYEAWKAALVESFLVPHLPEHDVLEIAPGFGRWSAFIAAQASSVTLVDINEKCLDACRQRLADYGHVTYAIGDGDHLPVPDASVDFVWSFDAFVHMDPSVISAYLAEIYRVLRSNGSAVIHHANKRPWTLALVPVTSRLGRPGRVVQQLASQGRLRDDGKRSHVTADMVADWATTSGLRVIEQTTSWGPHQEFTVDKYHDIITRLAKP